MNDALPIISIVVPCYNEQEVLPVSVKEMLGILDRMVGQGKISPESFILCCDDGSRDATWEIIAMLHSQDGRVRGISLAHNRGHQFALLAGLMYVKDKCDAAVSIDADLQDDPMAICEMVDKYLAGCNIVYGVRSNRESDSWFKRESAHAFYSLQKYMGIDIVYDHADFRLLDAKALELLSEYRECNVFLRGIVPALGLRSDKVYYRRNPRVAGESKYPLRKMLSFSIDGITSFSTSPMKFIFIVGVVMLVLDMCIAAYTLISYFSGNVIAGWTSLMLSVWFIGSLLLIALGIIGTYIGKIYIEVKQRPRYAVSQEIW